MGQKMRNAPVYFTLGQVQHNPILSLDTYLPTIQESMRKSGYPDFKRAMMATFNLTATSTPDSGQTQQPVLQKSERFLFSNEANTSGFVMLPNALCFQTTEYDTFESFSTELKRGLQILGDAIGGLSFVERLGLRYLDAVAPKAGESINKYLARELLGLPALMPESIFQYGFSECLLVAEGVGQVVSRTIVQNGPLGLPPDLQPVTLKISDRFSNVRGEHAVIDTDGSLTARRSFDVTDIERCMHGLHDLIDKTFSATVTDHARSAWN